MSCQITYFLSLSSFILMNIVWLLGLVEKVDKVIVILWICLKELWSIAWHVTIDVFLQLLGIVNRWYISNLRSRLQASFLEAAQ